MHEFIRSLYGARKVILRESPRPITPFGGLALLGEFLRRVQFPAVVQAALPFTLTSPNAIPPAETFTAFVFAVVAGAQRFAHTQLLRADHALHAVLGLSRFPSDDTFRHFFRRFGLPQVNAFFAALSRWQLARLPARTGGYTLDLDSTLCTRYGRQEGARKGFNPRRPGGVVHHPLLAVLAEAHFVLHAWLRSGNARASRGAVEFLREAFARLPAHVHLRCLRADSGFFENGLLSFLEERGVPYVIVARRTHGLKRLLTQVTTWTSMDADRAISELTVQLWGWSVPRRFLLLRERLREPVSTRQRLLFDVPGYVVRLLVTNRTEDVVTLWQDYHQRATMEQCIRELKDDLGAAGFCMQPFFATEAAFRSVLFVYNLLGEFQRAAGLTTWRQPATLRHTVFMCGALLGRSGRRWVLQLSRSWGGLTRRKPLLDRLRQTPDPTAPKLTPDHPGALALA